MAKGTPKDNYLEEFSLEAAKGGAIFTASSIARATATLLLLVILARLLRPADYGLYAVVIALAALFGLNTDYGVNNALRKKLPESKTNKRTSELISNAYFGAGAIAVVVAIGGIVFGGLVASNIYMNSALTEPIMIAFAAIIFSALFTVTMAALLGLRKSKEAGIGYIVYAISELVLSSTLVLFGYGILGALIGLLLALLIAFLVTFALLNKFIKYKIVRPTRKILTEIFSFSTPIFASNALSIGTYNLGIVLLGIFVAPFILGNYGAAFKLASFGAVIIAAFSQVLLPTYSYAISDKKLRPKVESIYNSSIHYTLVFLLPILVFLISVATPLVHLVLSGSYTAASLYFAIIATGIIAGILYKYGSQMVIGYGRIKTYTIYVMVASAVVVLLLFALTPLFGVYGVLISLFVVGPILLDIAFLRFMTNKLNIRFYWSKPLKVLITSVILLFLLIYLNSIMPKGLYTIAMNGVILLILYPPILALLRGIDMADLKFLRSLGERLHINFVLVRLLGYCELFMRKTPQKSAR